MVPLASLGPLGSTFLRLNWLFFFFFLSGSFGGVGSGAGNRSGLSSLYFLRANFCLLLTIFNENCNEIEREREKSVEAEAEGFRRVFGLMEESGTDGNGMELELGRQSKRVHSSQRSQ